ncbi:hypothetical protein R8Z50_10990 [Longispora sp. K20-0274]|uniref:hypothetical protein n=1 Tax=Longispora sp. K20-0274 TaxID=3088255 RepID=UPI00399B12AD
MSETPVQSWVPQACTLPGTEQALRVAEFEALFTDAVTACERPEPGRLRLILHPTPAVAAQAADLMVRETGCCSFFAFTLAAVSGTVTLDVAVDPPHTAVLDALAAQATAARDGRAR